MYILHSKISEALLKIILGQNPILFHYELLKHSLIDSHCHLDKIIETEIRAFSQVKVDISLSKPDIQFCMAPLFFFGAGMGLDSCLMNIR